MFPPYHTIFLESYFFSLLNVCFLLFLLHIHSLPAAPSPASFVVVKSRAIFTLLFLCLLHYWVLALWYFLLHILRLFFCGPEGNDFIIFFAFLANYVFFRKWSQVFFCVCIFFYEGFWYFFTACVNFKCHYHYNLPFILMMTLVYIHRWSIYAFSLSSLFPIPVYLCVYLSVYLLFYAF